MNYDGSRRLTINRPPSLLDRVWPRHVIVPNVADPGGEPYGGHHARHGIIHVIGPQLG